MLDSVDICDMELVDWLDSVALDESAGEGGSTEEDWLEVASGLVVEVSTDETPVGWALEVWFEDVTDPDD